MHRQLLLPIVIASSLIFAGAARADGYEPVARAAPVSLQVSNWTGFYANGGVGYGLPVDAQTTSIFRVAHASSVLLRTTPAEAGSARSVSATTTRSATRS